MKKVLFIMVLFALSFQTIAFCQTDSSVIKNAVSNLKTLLTDHIIEKVYLHFDHPYPYYAAGDVLYFKAYVTKGEKHELSNISGILHVDLINKNNTIIQSELVQLNYGLGWGDFVLADTLQKGSYRIRAYTEWMRNEKMPNFFEQYLSVSSINNIDRIADAAKQISKPVVQFFPEGGNLVTDVRSTIAFKALGPNGLGIDLKGVVVDNANNVVTKITSGHLGMGVFDFLPEAGKKYKANITFADGSQNTFDLPEVEEKGITLAVNTDDPTKVSIEIKANRPYYKENMNKQLNLLIYWAGTIRTISTKLDNEVLGVDLPASMFKTGVLKVSLLSQTGEPLNERLVFIQNPDLLNLSLATNKATYAKRENVQLSLNAKNKDGKNVNGFFSISVVDESKVLVDENSENTILTYLLLTSDIKGYVEKPNYYFANVNKETRANLDALMLTQGFRRFEWKQLLNNNTNTSLTYNPQQYLDIAGTLTTKAGAPIVDTKIILLPLGETETTDAQGHFKFAKVNYQSGTQFILKAPSESGKNAAVLTLDKPAPEVPVGPVDLIASRYNGVADILASLQNNQSQGVITASNGTTSFVVKSDRIITTKRKDNYRSSSLLGPGHADQVISGNMVRSAPSLSSGLNGLVNNVIFIQGVPYPNVSQLIVAGGAASNALLVVVDGAIEPLGTSVDDVNPVSVETVELLKNDNAAIYGLSGNMGVLVITTRQGSVANTDVGRETSPGVFAINPEGFYKAREFYAPVYNVNEAATKTPDLRTTIFWKPDAVTDIGGNATFNYFNADGTGTYRVVVEGIDAEGNLGRQVFSYKVE